MINEIIHFSLNEVVQWLIRYKYFILFPFVVVEGPITTVIAGFLASMQQLNLFLSLPIVVAADLTGDTIYYCLGRFGRAKFFDKYGKYVGLPKTRIEWFEQHFKKHPWKTYIFGKVANGTGTFILVAAGLSKTSYTKFLGYNFPITFAKSFVLIMFGFYFGHAYAHIASYLRIYGYMGLAVLIIIYFYLSRRYKTNIDNSAQLGEFNGATTTQSPDDTKSC